MARYKRVSVPQLYVAPHSLLRRDNGKSLPRPDGRCAGLNHQGKSPGFAGGLLLKCQQSLKAGEGDAPASSMMRPACPALSSGYLITIAS